MTENKRKALELFKFYGGNPAVLLSRDFFVNNSSREDKKAICKLKDDEFAALGWEELPRTALRKAVYFSDQKLFHKIQTSFHKYYE